MSHIPQLRMAYGPRERRGYVDDAIGEPARFAPLHNASRVAVTMPNGGQRWYAICPACGKRCTRLYAMADFLPVYWCRSCLGLRYRSQYQGRRIEASPKRLDWARERLRNASGKIDPDRADRLHAASDQWCARVGHHMARSESDFALTFLRILARIERHQAHLERRRAYMWLYRRGWRADDAPHTLPPAQPSEETQRGIAFCRTVLTA